jgi:hypothetical protein
VIFRGKQEKLLEKQPVMLLQLLKKDLKLSNKEVKNMQISLVGIECKIKGKFVEMAGGYVLVAAEKVAEGKDKFKLIGGEEVWEKYLEEHA